MPATAIDAMAKSGAGFAGFATWFDMTPAHPDMLAMPDPDTRHPAAVEAGGRLGRPAICIMDGKPVDAERRASVLKRLIAKAAGAGLRAEDRRRVRISF